jgi:hypothetical protein
VANGEWYDNKELYEIFMEKMIELNKELQKTQDAVKKYNNLSEKLSRTAEIATWCQNQLLGKDSELSGQEKLKASFREWGSFFFKLISTLIAIYYVVGALLEKLVSVIQ